MFSVAVATESLDNIWSLHALETLHIWCLSLFHCRNSFCNVDEVRIKGKQTSCKWVWKLTKFSNIPAKFVWLFYQYLCRESTFLLEILSSSECSQVGSLCTSKEQKRLAYTVIVCSVFCHRCRPCLWHRWYRLLGMKWQHSCFSDFQMLISNSRTRSW